MDDYLVLQFDYIPTYKNDIALSNSPISPGRVVNGEKEVNKQLYAALSEYKTCLSIYMETEIILNLLNSN